MADNPHPDTFQDPAAGTHGKSGPRLRLTPFAKGMLAGVLISLAVWILIAYVGVRFASP